MRRPGEIEDVKKKIHEVKMDIGFSRVPDTSGTTKVIILSWSYPLKKSRRNQSAVFFSFVLPLLSLSLSFY